MYHLRIATSQPPAITDSQPPPSCRLRVARMMFACSLPFVLPVAVGAPGVLPAPPFGADANGGWFDREVPTTSFDASACVATVLKSFSCEICSAASAAEKRTDSMEQVHITPAANGKKPNIVMVLLDDWCAFRYLNLSSAALADCTAQCADLGLVWIGALVETVFTMNSGLNHLAMPTRDTMSDMHPECSQCKSAQKCVCRHLVRSVNRVWQELRGHTHF